VPAAFSAMSQAQRLEHMKTVIRPRMAQVFQEHDAAKYADFGCRTCHGPNDDDPHAVLPVLTLSNGGYKKLLDEKTAKMLFMREKVTPTMVAAMGEPPFDMATRKGFGCSGCHRVQ
jgi:hypothetical protein